MEADIGVRMADQAEVVRNTDPAQPQMIAGAEAVDVVTHGGAGNHLRGKHPFGADEIVGGCELERAFVARDQCDGHSCGDGDCDVVGHRWIGGAVSGEERDKREALRGLDAMKAVAGNLTIDTGVAATERIDDGQGRGRAVAAPKRGNDSINHAGRDERAGGVVDQDMAGVDRLEPGEHRRLPRRAAIDRRGQGEALGGGIVKRAVVGVDHDMDTRDAGVREEGLERMPQHRLAADDAILLGHAVPGADPAAAGDDEGVDDHEGPYRRARGDDKGERRHRCAVELTSAARARSFRPKTYRGDGMRILIGTIVLAAMAAAPVAAAEDASVSTPIRQFVDAFNKGDLKAALANYATGDIAIIDDLAPHLWVGPKAAQAWAADLAKSGAVNGITEGAVKIGAATRTEVEGNVAYVVVPSRYTFKDHGKAMTEEGQMTFALKGGAKAWKISGWTWTGPVPHGR